MARKRRGRAEGSIFQREEDGLWVGTVSLGYNGAGKRIRKTAYGTTKSEVQEKLDRLRTTARVGTRPEAATMTVGQLLDSWLSAAKPKIAVRTHEEWERLVKNHVRPRLGGVKLQKLDALHVEGFYGEMHRDKVGPFAARGAADVLSIALNHAVRLKLIGTNPAAAIDKPKLPKREMLCLTDAQARAVRTAGLAVPVGPLLTVALATGCRQGELLALTWDDVDLRKGTLTVRRSLSQTKAGFVLKDPKTKASRRTVALPAFAVETLTALKAAAMTKGLLSAPVFCTRTGGYLDKKNVLRAFRAVVRRANKVIAAQDGPPADQGRGPELIPAKVRFHDLRHTVASLLLSKGHSLRAVSQRLGHSKPEMTLRVYAHCLPTDDAKLADGQNAMMA